MRDSTHSTVAFTALAFARGSGALFALGVLCYFCRVYQGKDRIWWTYLPGHPPRHPPGQDRGASSKEEALFQQYMRHEVAHSPLSI